MQVRNAFQNPARRIGLLAVTLAVVVSGAAGGIVQATQPAYAVSQAYTLTALSHEQPVASTSFQGEGLLDAVNRSVVTPQLRAHLGVGQGEGLVKPGTIVDFQVMQHSVATASLGLGQGEGFVGPGAIIDRRMLQNVRLKAHLGMYQGEGLLDRTNDSKPAPDVAQSGGDRADDLIKRGVGN